MKKLKCVLSVCALSLCLLSPAQAEEQRYISIRNTDMVWVPAISASGSFAWTTAEMVKGSGL